MSERDIIRTIIDNTTELPTKTIKWQAPANIAIVKYWGKLPVQIPMNPSISFSLQNAVTRTQVRFTQKTHKQEGPQVSFYFKKKENLPFQRRIEKYLSLIWPEIPWISEVELRIESENTFPDSAGIASSASAFAALALSLVQYEFELAQIEDPEALLNRASFLARLGSGSAARSVYGGWTSWGETPELPESSDLFAREISEIHPEFTNLQDAILLVSDAKKPVSSSMGHQLMETNPFTNARKHQAKSNHTELLGLLKTGDMMGFIELAEHEALTLHAMMMTARPGYTLLHPGSLMIIAATRAFRQSSGIPVGFTIDAGPNIHIVYPLSVKKEVTDFLQNELIQYCINGQWIDDSIGTGPQTLG